MKWRNFKFLLGVALVLGLVSITDFPAFALGSVAMQEEEQEAALTPEDRAIIEDLELLEVMDVLEEDTAFLQEFNTYEEESVELLGETNE